MGAPELNQQKHPEENQAQENQPEAGQSQGPLTPQEHQIESGATNEQTEDDDDNSGSLLFGGVILIPLTIYTYFQLSGLDQEGGEIEVHAFVAMLYDSLGTLGTTITMGLISLAMIGFGLKGMLKE